MSQPLTQTSAEMCLQFWVEDTAKATSLENTKGCLQGAKYLLDIFDKKALQERILNRQTNMKISKEQECLLKTDSFLMHSIYLSVYLDICITPEISMAFDFSPCFKFKISCAIQNKVLNI